MKIEKQVVSLELAKKLKELEVKQESLWWWIKSYDRGLNETMEWIVSEYDLSQWDGSHIEEQYSAFTVAELGEMLPNAIDINILRCMKTIRGEYICQYRANDVEGGKELCYTQADTEANARAKMVLYLVKEGKLKF